MINDNPKLSISLSSGVIFTILLSMVVLLIMFPHNSVLSVVITVLILRDGRR